MKGIVKTDESKYNTISTCREIGIEAGYNDKHISISSGRIGNLDTE